MGKSSEALRRAVKKHDTEKVDKITVRLPKGTKETILAMGKSVNAFIREAVLEKIKQLKLRGYDDN